MLALAKRPLRSPNVARIGFDGLMIAPDGKGHARSERHAVQALAARNEHDVVLFVREAVNIDGVEIVRIEPPLTIDWELRGLPAAARRHRLDAFVTLSERLPLAGALPVVVWLFESPLHRIRSNRRMRASLWNRGSDAVTSVLWRRSLRRAAHVAFGSQATRDEILAEIPLASTSVVYPGVPPGFSADGSEREGFVLHLGSMDPRDNTAVAVEACRRAGVPLRVVGGWEGDGADALGRVSDHDLLALYRRAAAFIDPTLYEGFGYGVLEAMACGAPVVASNATSIPEVAGDAAILCEPNDVDALAAAVRRVLDEPGCADEMRERGLRRTSAFNWDRTGEGLSAAIAAVLP
jgi:glycosyltransferase involved in cell wall biosynthesis